MATMSRRNTSCKTPTSRSFLFSFLSFQFLAPKDFAIIETHICLSSCACCRYPPNSQSLGVEADDFTRPRSKDQLFKLFGAVQGAHQEDPAMMEQAWASALMRRGETVSDSAKMSLVEFRAVFNDLHH